VEEPGEKAKKTYCRSMEEPPNAGDLDEMLAVFADGTRKSMPQRTVGEHRRDGGAGGSGRKLRMLFEADLTAAEGVRVEVKESRKGDEISTLLWRVGKSGSGAPVKSQRLQLITSAVPEELRQQCDEFMVKLGQEFVAQDTSREDLQAQKRAFMDGLLGGTKRSAPEDAARQCQPGAAETQKKRKGKRGAKQEDDEVQGGSDHGGRGGEPDHLVDSSGSCELPVSSGGIPLCPPVPPGLFDMLG